MGNDIRHVRGEAQKELVKKFEVFTSKGRSRWQVWSDWITISAIAVSNATDKSHFDEREQQYMTIVKKYTKQEVDALPMAGWSWAVNHMAGPKAKNAKEGT